MHGTVAEQPKTSTRRRRVFVVATAAKDSGAWTITQHLAEQARNDASGDYTFITVRPLNVAGVDNVVVNFSGVVQRARFEFLGIRRLLRRAKPVDAVLSLNNLPVAGALGIPQYVYIQNSIPFHGDQKWNFSRAERLYFFYRNIYGPLMRWSIKLLRAKVIVQTATMAERIREAWGMDAFCWFPAVSTQARAADAGPNTASIDFIYPATLHPHKNHKVLIQALSIVKRNRSDVYSKIRVLFTVNEDALVEDDKIVRLGTVPREQLFSLYAGAGALVFPSLMETVGLPLVETSALGLPILCADLDYAREILGHYEGARFLDSIDAEQWAAAMIEIADETQRKGGPIRYRAHTVGIRKTNFGDIAPLGAHDVQR